MLEKHSKDLVRDRKRSLHVYSDTQKGWEGG